LKQYYVNIRKKKKRRGGKGRKNGKRNVVKG